MGFFYLEFLSHSQPDPWAESGLGHFAVSLPLFPFISLPAFQAPINDSLSALRDVPVDVLFFRRCNFLTMFSVLMEPRLATYSSRETLVAMPANRESRRNRAGMGVSGQGEICTLNGTGTFSSPVCAEMVRQRGFLRRLL